MLMPSSHTTVRETTYTQLHIDAARYATDDFNPFHDKRRWQRIAGNPFPGPLVLGFQQAALLEDAVRQHRLAHDEAPLLVRHQLIYSNYQFSFAGAVLPGQRVDAEVRGSRLEIGDSPQLVNRLVLRADGAPVLLGFKRESPEPLLAMGAVPDVASVPDRSYLADGRTYLKRKFVMTGNGKTFLLGAGVEPSDYIDEIGGRIGFPETFALSFLSCALLERGLSQGHDFAASPLVYAAHRYSVDRRLMTRVTSNAPLNLLVGEPSVTGEGSAQRHAYPCRIVLNDGAALASAELVLAPLAALRGRTDD
jgi:acyl dehydratase